MLQAQFPILYLPESYVINDFPLHRYNYSTNAYEEGNDDIGKFNLLN